MAPTKKARTHERIVSQAAKLFRQRGIQGASVDDVMAAADLTRGGFYAHFADKSALVAEALDHAFAESRRALFVSPHTGRGWLVAALDRYLSAEHLDDTSGRCPIPTLAGDVARSDAVVRAVFTKNIRQNITVAEAVTGARGKQARAYVIKMLSACAGALVLARATDDRALALEILDSARRDALREYDERFGKPSSSRRSDAKHDLAAPLARKGVADH